MVWVKNQTTTTPADPIASDKLALLNRLGIINGKLAFDGKIMIVADGGGTISLTSLQSAFSASNLTNATAINETDDLLSHCISLDVDENGYVYGAYYADKTDSTERIGNDNTKIYLIKFDPKNPATVERWLVAQQGSVFTNLTQYTSNAPYDPLIKVLPDKVKIFFLGHEPTGFKVGSVDFDKNTKTIGTTFNFLNMKYNGVTYQSTVQGIKNLYSAGLGKVVDASFIATITKFVYKNGYYYTTIYGTGFQGAILRTTDFINFDVFAFMTGAESYAWIYAENSIEFLSDDKIVAMSRTNDDVLLKSVYTISTKTWETWSVIATPEAKPTFVRDNANLYAMYNTTVDRNTLQIDKVDSNGQFTAFYTATSTASIQYPDYINVGNITYFAFSNDRKNIGGSRRSTMSFLPIT